MSKLTADSLKGIWAGPTLPWKEDYSLDEPSYRENLRRLCVFNVHGIYTSGSSGEFYALDWPEFQQVVSITMEVVSPTGIPVQIGCSGDDTRDILRKIDYAAGMHADGVQVALPYWMQLTDQEVLQFFKEVSGAFPDLPLIHYNILRAKRYLLGEDYRRILEVAPNLIGVKFVQADSRFGELQSAIRITPEISYSVSEGVLVSAMQVGARGSYSSLVYWNPEVALKLYALAEARQWDEALKMQSRVARFFREVDAFAEEIGLGVIDPVGDKGLAVATGFFVGHQRTRPPYIGWSDSGVKQVREWIMERYPEFMAPDIP